MQRPRVWLAVSPLVVGGVVAAHALAYRLTGTSTGSFHEYLDHVPQILLVLGLVGLAANGLGARLQTPCCWPFPVAALATFVLQEHVERLVHTGELPWLLDSPAFVVGVLLQLPFALVAWALARRLLDVLAEPSVRAPQLPRLLSGLVTPESPDVRRVRAAPLPGRGPPILHGP